jgi:hypothetical protein
MMMPRKKWSSTTERIPTSRSVLTHFDGSSVIIEIRASGLQQKYWHCYGVEEALDFDLIVLGAHYSTPSEAQMARMGCMPPMSRPG